MPMGRMYIASKGKQSYYRKAQRRPPIPRPVASNKYITYQALQKILSKRTEYKFIDYPESIAGWGSSGLTWANAPVVHLTDIDQGDTVNLRDGNSISVTSLQVKGNIEMITTTTKETEFVRVIMFAYYVDQDHDTPAHGSIFPDNELSTNVAHIPFRLIGNRKRTKIFFDRTYKVAPDLADYTAVSSANGATPNSHVIRIFKKFRKPWKVYYEDGTGSNKYGWHFFLHITTSNTTASCIQYRLYGRTRWIE